MAYISKIYTNDIKITDDSNNIEYFSIEHHSSLNKAKKNTQCEITSCIEENDIPAGEYIIEQKITDNEGNYIDRDEGTIIIKDDKSFEIII